MPETPLMLPAGVDVTSSLLWDNVTITENM